MKTKIIEMYRPSQYKSWEEAHDMGGVYAAQVPEDTPDSTISALVGGARICMSADDRIIWRVRLPELTPFQKAFIEAYQYNVHDVTTEKVEEFVRNINSRPEGVTLTEFHYMANYYFMFIAGSKYDSRG